MSQTLTFPIQAQTNSKKEAIQLVVDSEKLVDKGDYQTATENLKIAIAFFANSGDQLNLATALTNLSLTYQYQSKWHEAEKTINDSLSILQNFNLKGDQQLILATSLDIQGKLQKETGKPEEALLTWQKSQQIYQQLGNQEAETLNLLNQTQALKELGFYPRACETLLGVLGLNLSQIAQTANLEANNCQAVTALNKQETAQLITSFEGALETKPKLSEDLQVETIAFLGEIFVTIGNLPLGKHLLEISEAQAQALNYPETLASIKLSLGNTALLENLQNPALTYYQSAGNITQDLNLQLKSNLNQLSILVTQQKWDEVAALKPTIENQIEKSPLTTNKIYSRLKLAKNLMCWQRKKLSKNENISVITQQCSFNDNPNRTSNYINQAPSWEEIATQLTPALTETQSLNNPKATGYVLGYLGAIAQENNQLSQAEDYTQKALEVVSNLTTPELRYSLLWQLGRIEKSQEKTKEALISYQAAYDSLQSLRTDLVTLNREVQFNFRDSVEPVYREYVSSLLDQQGQQVSQDNLQKSLEAIEALQLAEINNFFRDACVEVRPESLADIVNKTEEGTAIIYAAVLPEKVAAILKLPQEKDLKSNFTSIAQKEVEKRINSLLEEDLKTSSKAAKVTQPKLQEVYDWLVKSFAQDLKDKKITTLVFVLDGQLRNIPMAALYDGNKYLIENYAVAVTPGLRILQGEPLKEVKARALTGGISEDNVVENRLYGALENVPAELTTIKDNISTVNELLNQQLVTDKLQKQVETANFNVLHLATHGSFSSDPEQTFIVLWGNELKAREFDKLLRLTNKDEKNPLELLVLSACETAAGDGRATLGLAGISLRAGARSTLASLWLVSDSSTSKLMQTFYEQLNQPDKKISKAKALQQAQLAILKTNENDWDRPYYWAPFILVGDWQ